ncbi:endodeoxyribonuclease [Pyruvatibacter mobilis]|uniref:Endodeoxyribonuclease n=1 Tax=Pyruvatibacter mobilis TaxID=1712261 RepID=A0A845Q7W6_9HYPH|nr:endodeoxyribonuclease [Pyruvatibacter mobilis]NBG94479.1 endodeoxyribonuclease [Pyruvatibacter mobilis]QJD74000.1 endodeoxyribonuclease [Pyruvatibacter mobilis]GGD03274.1 hypothetical protein GCM10011587_03740 [Pyruvatibacter mobilis]
MAAKKTTTTTTSDRAVAQGWRSGLESKIGKQLEDAGVPVQFEAAKIEYEKPARKSKYTPDFLLPNGIIIESKGRFLTADRQKHLLIQKEHPDLDIRFVFSNSRTRISKQSKTTYAMWCEKNGFLYADKLIPEEWLNEPLIPERGVLIPNQIRASRA